jgi:DNA polymerase-2
MTRETAWLFDLYPERDRMVLWFVTEAGGRLRLAQPFAPSFFVDGLDRALDPAGRRSFDRALAGAAGLTAAGMTSRLDFWTGAARRVLEVRVTDLDRAQSSLLALAERFPALDYYDCDIAPEILFGYETGLFPTARCEIEHDGCALAGATLLDDPLSTDYALPPLRAVELEAEGALAGPRPRMRALTVRHEGEAMTWEGGAPEEILASLRAHLERIDPDIIWTRGGDALLLPALFALAQRLKIPLGLDREPSVARRLEYHGRTYMSYGRVLYHAPDHPLFGRWHIDRNNSFWAGHCDLSGLIEVARVSKIPVQRAARRSIGTGISSIQLDWAHRQGFLIPWEKSRPEAWKSVWRFMHADRGGLVFQPLTGVYEDVWELDFVSMYPTIMARENVSPETVDCACCEPRADVPELGYTLCRRRRGMTAQTLWPIIERRARYKTLRREAKARGDAQAYRVYDCRQDALKWLLVCCFGYLGYRNARFGRIEAHEATCAFSREKLLRAKAVSEGRGFEVLHAIVDCVWLRKAGATREEIDALCEAINRAVNLTIAVEGHYAWLVFLPSRQNPDLPVPNRYFGAFEDGELKFRGIEARRSDQAPYVQRFQKRLLEELARARSVAECRAMRARLVELVREAESGIRNREAPIGELLLRRKTSREAADYQSNAMTAVAARQAARAGVKLHAGEGVEFLVLDPRNVDPDSRLRIVALLRPEEAYDVEFYAEQVRRAAATVLEPLLGEPLENLMDHKAAPPAPRAPRCEQLELFAAD